MKNLRSRNSDNLPTVLITGGAGFIGSALCRYLVNEELANVVNLDKMTYAANSESLKEIDQSPLYSFEQGDICDRSRLDWIFEQYQPDGVLHLAAESHVDRSIDGAADFINTNFVGTFHLLEAARGYWNGLEDQSAFKFLHISTDEVYGSLTPVLNDADMFTEETSYAPSSPYSASKASSDHLVRAWNHTYGLPVVMTNCSNNYGPYHFPEKLIPLIILNALDNKELPIYGKGDQIRDWLYVDDHAKALWLVWSKGQVGQGYNVGGRNERQNIDVVKTVCSILDELAPDKKPNDGYASLISYVADRPGHDLRYAIDATKLETELGWKAEENFDTGIRKTIQWYLDNEWWWAPIRAEKYSGQRRGKA